MSFEQTYRDSETVWGEKPDSLLAEIAPLVPRGRVLDLGMGEGRNAIFFARQGFDVTGIDISPSAVEKCRDRAAALGIPIRAETGDLLTAAIEPESYTLGICAMALQFVKKSESEAVIARIKAGLQPGGIIYLTTFSTEDPSLARMKHAGSEVEPNTFFSEKLNSHIHFFEKEELLAQFGDFSLQHFAQTVSLDPGHPGVPDPHYHGILTYIGKKL